MLFNHININMNYKLIYNKIIHKAKLENRIKSPLNYYEKHHIIPKSIGGNNTKDNIILLNAREHFLCHWLLWKFVEGDNKYKMGHAFGLMRFHDSDNRYYTSLGYSIARKAHSISASNIHKGKKLSKEQIEKRITDNPNAKKVTINGIEYKSRKEAIEKLNTTKLRLYKFLKNIISYEELIYEGIFPQSQERKEKVSKRLKGKTYEELYGIEKANIMKEQRRLLKLGKNLSTETKEKIRQSHLNNGR